jgi:hypothetical protein
LPDEADFFDRSSATVKKTCEVWRKMGLFGPDSAPPNQLQTTGWISTFVWQDMTAFLPGNKKEAGHTVWWVGRPLFGIVITL